MVLALLREEKELYGTIQVDQDGLWKKVISELFEDFLLFFVPELYKHIDFHHPPQFLDKELFQEEVEEKKDRRFADQLAKVRLKNGEEKWILVHVEVQSSEETGFPERMFQYFYRIYDRHKEKIVAKAVHISPATPSQQLHFEYDYFGTVLNYSYTNCRIEDYPEEVLERSEKIFSKVLLAAKVLHQTKGKEHQRYLFKGKLMRELVRSQNYSRTAVQATLHFIDYLLQLPEEIRPLLRKEKQLMEQYNKENASPTILNTFDLEWERGVMQGIEKGMAQGMELKQKEIAKKLIIEQVPLETITTVTGLTADEVKDIQKTLN